MVTYIYIYSYIKNFLPEREPKREVVCKFTNGKITLYPNNWKSNCRCVNFDKFKRRTFFRN